VGFGDPNDPNIIREDLIYYKLTTHYRIKITLEGGERKAFVWKRTNHTGIGEEMPSKLSMKNSKLIDEQTE
jgi:hypothetical protein